MRFRLCLRFWWQRSFQLFTKVRIQAHERQARFQHPEGVLEKNFALKQRKCQADMWIDIYLWIDRQHISQNNFMCTHIHIRTHICICKAHFNKCQTFCHQNLYTHTYIAACYQFLYTHICSYVCVSPCIHSCHINMHINQLVQKTTLVLLVLKSVTLSCSTASFISYHLVVVVQVVSLVCNWQLCAHTPLHACGK